MADPQDDTAPERRQSQTQLNTLWEQHAADPGQQALVCAQFCFQGAPHLAESLKARIHAHLSDALLTKLLFHHPDDGRIQALSLLSKPEVNTPRRPVAAKTPSNQPAQQPERGWQTTYSPIDDPKAFYQAVFEIEPQIVAKEAERLLRSDPELGRLAIALHLAHQYRFWVVAQQLNREGGGAGRIEKAELKRRLSFYGVSYTDRQIRRILVAGEGLFWQQDRRQPEFIYLTGWRRLGVKLVELAGQSGCEIGWNRPGARQHLVDVAGGLEQWEAQLYASWTAHRDGELGLSISRKRQAALFGRSEKTIRQWEDDYLKGVISKRFDYELHPDDQRTQEELYDLRGHVPEHAREYTTRTRQGSALRRYWQRVNTYTSSIQAHNHGGQARKVRRAVNSAISADTDGGLWRMYYTLEQHQKRVKSRRFRMGMDGDVNEPVHVFIGVNKRMGVWELMIPDPAQPYPTTRASELVLR